MDYMGFTSVGSITVICYLIAEIIKSTSLPTKWLPSICGLLGGILGVVAMSIVRDFPADDLLSAIAVGIVSGLAATGVNQVFRQLANHKSHPGSSSGK